MIVVKEHQMTIHNDNNYNNHKNNDNDNNKKNKNNNNDNTPCQSADLAKAA